MKSVANFLLRLALGLLLGGLLSTILVRFAPGYGVDERELDPTLSESTRARIRQQAGASNIWSAYSQFVMRTVHGDFGFSSSLNSPVVDLLADRAPLTVKTVAGGVILAWAIALPFAAVSVLWKGAAIPLVAASTVLLCLPLGLVAICLFLEGIPAAGVVAAGVLPKVFTYMRQLLSASGERPHVLGAMARGISPWRVFWMHRVVPTAPESLSLLGVSITIALGAAIPAEVLCDSPGLGQLAWKAAVARDIAPLLTLTWLMTAITFTANTLGGAAANSERMWRE